MNFEVRRVVVTNDAAGVGRVVTDEILPAVSRGVGRDIDGSEMWSTRAMPADNSAEADAAQRKGFVETFNYVGTGQGTAFRITHWQPGHARFTHRTQTLDYDIVLAGEIDLELEGGEVVHLKTGDVVIMRGCTHTWMNRTEKAAVTAFMLIDASPVELSSGALAPVFPEPSKT